MNQKKNENLKKLINGRLIIQIFIHLFFLVLLVMTFIFPESQVFAPVNLSRILIVIIDIIVIVFFINTK